MPETIVERLVFVCPFCARRAAVVDVMPENTPGVVHDKPECREFVEKDPIEYIAACNVALKRRMN